MYIYVISHPKFKGWIKLGRTIDLQKRLNGYQVYCPHRLFKIEYSIKTNYPCRIENYFMNHVKSNGYEWFKCSVSFAINEIKNKVKEEGQLTLKIFEKKLDIYHSGHIKYYDYLISSDNRGQHIGEIYNSVKQLCRYLKLNKSDFACALKNSLSTDKIININGYKIIRKLHEK